MFLVYAWGIFIGNYGNNYKICDQSQSFIILIKTHEPEKPESRNEMLVIPLGFIHTLKNAQQAAHPVPQICKFFMTKMSRLYTTKLNT